MRFSSRKVFMGVLFSLAGSCSGFESYLFCADYPDEPRCKSPVINSISISPRRLHYHFKGMINLKNVNKPYHAKLKFADDSEIILQDITQGQNVLNMDLSANSKLGAASLELSPINGGGVEKNSIRLYANSSLKPTGTPFSPSVNPNNDGKPIKIGIGIMKGATLPNVLVSLNRLPSMTTIAKVYQYDSSKRMIVYPVQLQVFDNLSNLLSISVVQDGLIEYYFQSNGGNYPANSSYCAITNMPAMCTAGIMLDANNKNPPYQFLADRRPGSSVYAVSKDGKQMSTYELGTADVSSTSVPFPNTNWASDISGMLAAFGDLDGDQKGELIAWQKTASDSKVLVFLRGANGFQYNQPYSQALQKALGAADIGAIAAGDLDGDQLDDLVVAQANVLSVVSNQTVDPSMPNFSTSTMLTSPPKEFTKIEQISVGAIRAASSLPTDNCLDIAIATTDTTGWLEVYINNPS